MDWYSHRLANRLVGNADTAAALEITLLGPELTADGDLTCAVAGGRFDISCGGSPVAPDTTFSLRRGDRLVIRGRTAGARATLAFAGGLDVPPVLGSRSTSLLSRLGPFGGRQLTAGDVLPIGGAVQQRPTPGLRALPLPDGGTRLRVVIGPHEG